MKIKSINLNQVLTVAAILGFISAFYMVFADQKKQPIAQPVTPPSVSPFKSFIAGSGIIEAESDNIAIGTLVSGTIDRVMATQGVNVKKGDTLFTLDSRQANADVQLKTAQLAVAQTVLEQANANLKNAQDEFDLISKVKDSRAYTKEEFITRQNNVLIAQSSVNNAKANIVAAQAQLESSKVNLSLYETKAPLDCQILQVNVHPGEFATANMLTTPLVLIGGIARHHIRVNIDENDAWRFIKDAPAIAFLRGNIQFKTNLKFEYIEPYVIPKTSLTGDATERVDIRVFQVVYSYNPLDMPSFLGQQVDVYIEAKEVSKDAKYGGPLEVSK